MSSRPVTLSVAAIIEGLEGFVVLVAGLYVGVEAVIGHPADLPSAIALSVIAVLSGAGMLIVGRGLWQARRWCRAPGVLTQIFALIVSVSMIQSKQYAVGTALLGVGVAGVVAMLSKPTTQALVDE